MYSDIHHFKDIGLNKTQVANRLNLNYKTVRKYWDVTPEEFLEIQKKKKARKLDKYHDCILAWLKQFPDISTAQVHDWLIEHYQDKTIKDRTLRNYIVELRIKHDIPKQSNSRQYQALADPPMGYQLQVDFGQIKLRNNNGGKTKIYGMGAVLSNSRFKYGEWVDKPFTTSTLISMLTHCFEYLGGVPKEIVFDQDKIVAVSENYGDIIYTYEFEKFKKAMGFKVYLCKAFDPESKGRIEAVVKYMKYNFAINRLFTDIRTFNKECWDWLERTANAKVHGTTKKVPAEVFALEKQHLQPIPHTIVTKDILTRTVRKDNTILYLSSRYTVPIGTYKLGVEVEIAVDKDKLVITDKKGNIIAKHNISTGKGELIRNSNHLRCYDTKLDDMYDKTLELLGGNEAARLLLETIRKEKGRYIREQFGLIKSVVQSHSSETLDEALKFCYENNLNSAVDIRDAADHYAKQKAPLKITALRKNLPPHLAIKTEVRKIDTYTSLYGGEVK